VQIDKAVSSTFDLAVLPALASCIMEAVCLREALDLLDTGKPSELQTRL